MTSVSYLQQCRLLPWLAAVLLLAPLPTIAEVVSANGSTSSRAVIGTPSAISLDWRVDVFNGASDRSMAVISSEAFIALEGDIAEHNTVRVPQPLKRLLPPPASPAPQTAIFRETVVVPAEISDLALAAGLRVFIVRQFRDQNTAAPVVAAVQVPLGGGNTAQLRVSRIALRFPDGSQEKILGPGARSHVLADISYTGSGRFDAVWEIAEPSSTAGEPLYRTVSAVHRYLVAGLRSLTLRSPSLPTGMDGVHLLRLRVIAPRGFVGPTIPYYVNRALQPRPAPARIFAYSPGDNAIHESDTSFRWSPLSGTTVYQIEFFPKAAPGVLDRLPELGSLVPDDRPLDGPDAGERYPLTGVMVTGISTQTSLSKLSLSHLTPGQSYEWRVSAYDVDGQLIGTSALRTLVIPDDSAPPGR